MKEMGKIFFLLCIAGLLAFSGATAKAASPEDAPRMPIEDLKELVDNAESDVLILDVRTGASWDSSDVMIQSAVREEPGEVNSWREKYAKDVLIVLYCTWMNEFTSARVALKLMEEGFKNVYALEGGFDAWEEAGYPLQGKSEKKE